MSISVDDITGKIFDNFKKITPALVAVTILTGLLLFLPENILFRMSLDKLRDSWKQIIGMLFLLSITLICTMIFFSLISRIVSIWRKKISRLYLKNKYRKLSITQKAIILKLLRSKAKTIMLDKNSGDTIYLLENRFLHQPEQVYSLGWNNEIILIYVPQLWLMELYNEEPELFT
jgi:hypothetical protein